MNPVLAQIRGQLPNETASFGLVVRGKVIEGKRPAYIGVAIADGQLWNAFHNAEHF
jgi:hypothetical protein